MKISEHIQRPHMVATFLMNGISRICRQLVDRQMRPIGLTRAQWYMLNYVYLYEGLSQQELADLIDFSKSNVAKHIRSLEKKGWVARGAHEHDGRSFRVHLTADMKPTIRKLNKLAELTLRNVLDDLPDDAIPLLIAGLKSVDRHLESEFKRNIPIRGARTLIDDIVNDLKTVHPKRGKIGRPIVPNELGDT